VRGVLAKLDSGAVRLRKVHHGVVQAAGRANDRDGAVAKGIELAEPTRLVTRRHQEKIASTLDSMREPEVEVDSHRQILWSAGRQALQTAFQRDVPAAEDRQLESLAEHHRDRGEKNIDSFLHRQSSNQSKQRQLHVGGISQQSQLPKQRPLGLCFAAQVARGVPSRQRPILGRIPLPIVDAVEDADQARAKFSQQSVESTTQLRRLDFSGVGGGDGREPVREDQPRFEKTELPVKLELLWGEKV